MSGDALKKLYEKIPTGVKSAFAPLFVRAMVDNRVYRETWDELERFEAMSAGERREFQLMKLRAQLEYAYIYVPYYRALFDKRGVDLAASDIEAELAKLPLLEKSDAVAAGDALYSTDTGLNYFETFTGGSSGQALKVLLDKDSVYRERAFACHEYVKYGFNPRTSKTAAFWGHNKQMNYYFSPLKNEIVISPFRLYREASAVGIVRDIERFGATFLAGYPSAIFQFVKAMEAEGLRLPVSHVFYYAENYEPDKRDFVDAYLGCTSSSDYGHTEHAVKAEVGDDFVQFNDLYGYTELVPVEGMAGEFRIVCTGFTSRKMPLIRYATDDVVEVAADGTRRLVGHKKSDVCLVGKNGALIFKGAMTLHVDELAGIAAYQYYQTEAGRAELLLVAPGGLSKSQEENVMQYIRRRTEGLLDVEIRYVDKVKTSTRGKALWAVVDRGGGALSEHRRLCNPLRGRSPFSGTARLSDLPLAA